ncbi:MAG: PQQ-binding-like beta-propeller repeat protein [Planctomycetota bacterium]
MVPNDASEPHARSWPALLFVLAQAAAVMIPKRIDPSGTAAFFGAVFSGPVCLLLVAAWWTSFSRVRWAWKWPVIVTYCGAYGLLVVFGHESTGGGVSPVAAAMPAATTAGVIAFGLTYLRPTPMRVGWSSLAIAVTFGVFGLVEVDGFSGDFTRTYARWRWTPSAEEAYLDGLAADDVVVTVADDAVRISGAAWPGFRGPAGDGSVAGVTLATDWDADPPREVWRRPVGPAWSSFAYVDGRLFTQEQRGDEEAVVCWDAGTGREIWSHLDATRFTEAVGGVGPRATPTVAGGRVYAVGANGTVNCLDAATGSAVWSRDLVADSGTPVPIWGFASSPAVTESRVIVMAGGPKAEGEDLTSEQKRAPYDKSVIAYDRDTGEVAWTAAAGRKSYASPAVVTLAGRLQVLVVTDVGLDAFDPADGAVLWSHRLVDGVFGIRNIQPAVVSATDVVLPPSDSGVMRRLRVVETADGYDAEVVWEAKTFKPNFNDYVVADGHAYGFDVHIFASVDLSDGSRNWKRGRYGFGQVVLLDDAVQLLVTTENTGELVLLAADPGGHEELARIDTVSGKAWNHPIVVGRYVFVRSDEEAVCFELPLAETTRLATR